MRRLAMRRHQQNNARETWKTCESALEVCTSPAHTVDYHFQADKGTQDANGSALLTCGNIVNRNCSFGNVYLTSGTEDVSIMPMSALNCPLKLELH